MRIISVDAAVQVAFPMIKAKEYRSRAEQCERDAKLSLDADIRKQLERIAQHWRELALLRERRAQDEM
jgi:hypothetical protein